MAGRGEQKQSLKGGITIRPHTGPGPGSFPQKKMLPNMSRQSTWIQQARRIPATLGIIHKNSKIDNYLDSK